jgi:hypothetical protein
LRQARDSLRAHLSADLDELMRPVVATSRARPAPGVGLSPALAQAPERVGCEAMRRCIFGAYMQPDLRPADRAYAEVTDAPALLSRLEAYMADHDGARALSLGFCRPQRASGVSEQVCMNSRASVDSQHAVIRSASAAENEWPA